MDGCPRDTGPFLVETTEKIFMFAADREQLDDWTQKLCEIAFPVSTHPPGASSSRFGYNWGKKIFGSHRLCKLSHFKRRERSVMFIVSTLEL